MQLLPKILLICGLSGILTATVYLLMVMAAVIRFRRRPKHSTTFTPPVSLLKPLHGAEPGLRDYLEGFFLLGYPQYEILFCARHSSDPGLVIARELSLQYPHIPVRILTSGEPRWPNARCYSLSEMKAAAQHGILVITDSDVRVTPQYLRAVVEPLREASTGLVTCVYRGVAAQGGFWARLEGLGMSIEMTSGVLVADMLEGMRFALGPSMVVRKRCVDEIGGFEKLGHYYADDFMLGNLVSGRGSSVILSNHIIDHCIVNSTFAKSLIHQWNWMKSTRFSRPLGHLGTGLTFAVPFGLLSLLAASLLGRSSIGLAALAWTAFSQMLRSALVGGLVVKDLLGFILWAASYASRRVGWRSDLFEFTNRGVVRLVPAWERGVHLKQKRSVPSRSLQ